MPIKNPFGRFFDDPDLEQVEGFINGILSTPSSSRTTDSDGLSSEFLEKAFNVNEDDKNEIDNLFSQFNVPAERLLRYSTYEEMYKAVPLIKRIVKVYKPYIIQKNPVTSLWYNLTKTDYAKEQQIEDEQKAKDAKVFFKDTVEYFKLQQKLKDRYIHNQLLFGDCYVEVVDLKEEKSKVDLEKVSILNEISVLNLEKDTRSFNKNTSDLQLEIAINTLAENLITINEQLDPNELEKEDNIKFQNTLLRTHRPHNVIVLTTKYDTVLGFLEVSRRDSDSSSTNISQALSTITSRLVSVSNSREEGSITNRDAIVNKIINFILKKTTSKNGTKFDKSVIEDLKRFLIEQNVHRQQLNIKPLEVRFIPVSRMVSFSLPSGDNYPHGSSIIDALILPGKLFILSQLSNIFMKLSRAPLSRKWIIDQGSVQMPGQLLQKLKRELKNNRVAIEELASFKSISKIMSDYKDTFILSKNGQRALDVETTAVGDSTIKVADLEDSRKELVALSGVPGPLT